MATRAQAQTVNCPACASPPDQECTQPTDAGRKKVTWVHLSRESEFEKLREMQSMGIVVTAERHPHWCKCQRVCGGDQ